MTLRWLRCSISTLLVAGFLILAVVASLALASRVSSVVTWLDVGSPGDDEYTNLFFPPESNADETFRWSAERAELSIPVGRPGRYQLDLRIATVRPEGRSLEMICGSSSSTLAYSSLGADSTAAIECQTETGTVELELLTSVVHLPNGGRPLGVSVRDVQVTALDSDDRQASTFISAVTIFGSLAGLFFAMRSLRSAPFIVAALPAGLLLIAWWILIARFPDSALSAVSGPGGLIALIAGLGALLARGGHRIGLVGMAVAAIVSGFLWEQPDGVLVLESLWVMEELAALVILPWLAILALITSSLVRGERAHWLASGAVFVAIASLFLPALAARTVETRIVEVSAPAWTGHGGIAGAIYVLAVFALFGIALFSMSRSRLRPAVALTAVVAFGISGLLLWRIQIMLFNGDEPHYYTTARSLAKDRDLELLNNYVSERYQSVTYSPVGNIAVERDGTTFRYAAGVQATVDAWIMIPDLGDGWDVPGDREGLTRAINEPVILSGPDGALTVPPPLVPATRQAIVLEGPCEIPSIDLGLPPAARSGSATITVLNANGATLWTSSHEIDEPISQIEVPDDFGLCVGNGLWTVSIDSTTEILAQALDRFNGLQFLSGNIGQSWMYGGLPRDRYGSIDVSSRVLIHNPAEATVLATIRLLTESDQTTSEITVGLAPGETVIEPLPVFGATAVSIISTGDAGVAVGMYGIVDGARYRIPPMTTAADYSVALPANSRYDSGLWLTLLNPAADSISVRIGVGNDERVVDVCPVCAVTELVPATKHRQQISVDGVEGEWFGATAVVYEERTGQLHYDIGLPLVASSLALFDEVWAVLLLTAVAGILLAPGLWLLLRPDAKSNTTLYLVAIVVMLAPFSTYAVRFYTDLFAGTLLVWALVLWERSERSNLAGAGAAAIALTLPVLHGRLTLLAAALLGLVVYALLRANWERLAGHSRRRLGLYGFAAAVVAFTGVGLVLSQFAIALQTRGIENFIRTSWILPNTFGMLLDRGSGVLPYAPWVLFALAVPLRLARAQRAALALAILYYALLTLRAGGWQTWGSPIRYLLPVMPLIALLAIPGMARLWDSGRRWRQALIVAVLAWSTLVTAMLHWLPLSGYIDRATPGNVYLIDDALAWLPVGSPFTLMPTIEALDGPAWGVPVGIAILCLLAIAAAWPLIGIVRSHNPATEGQ